MRPRNLALHCLDFVFYEVDCIINMRNPYIPLSANNPTMAADFQRTLTGEGSEERKEIFKKAIASWRNLLKGDIGEEDWANIDLMFEKICENILSERERTGGDWAVAGALTHRRIRDTVRSGEHQGRTEG